VLALTGGNAANAVLSFAFVGAVAGFLIFNLPPARIFMGDGGSLFAGSFLATLAITQAGPGGSSLILGIPIVLLTIPLLDTVAALFRRLRRRMPIHTPDREHFHHLLLDRAGSNRRALLVGYGLSALLGVSALVYAYAPPPSGVAFLVGGPAVVISVYVVLDRQTQRLRVRSLEQQLASHSARNGSAVDMTNGSEADIKTVKHHTVEDTHHRQ
jgi:UDP-GlcNAc:undecaprenyl-phosphate GlcNAc-1-phosphate transferase